MPRLVRGESTLFGPPSTHHRFIPYLPAHLQLALSMAAHFMELANARPGDEGLGAVLDEAEQQARSGDPEWVKYALRVFLTHHPEGRRLSVPPLRERAPHQVLPSGRPEIPRKGNPGTPGAEVWLDYFREDTGLSEHLDTWQVLHPAAGVPDPEQPKRRLHQDRHGERLWYMNQQLLARYDTERLSFGMPRTVPLGDYASPINEGYDAELPGFASRPPGLSPRNLPGYSVTDHAMRRDRLFTAASSGLLWQEETPVVIERLEQLANTAESNPGSVDGEAWVNPLGPYGSHHSLGHMLLGCLTAPQDKTGLPGVLVSPATAARDPLFYRWHRHVDDILDAWQSTHLPPYELSNGPQVLVRKWLGEGIYPAHQSPDILFCFIKDIPEAASPDFDGQRWGEATFGGDYWTSPPPSFRASTHALNTFMAQHPVRLPDGREVLKQHLDHEPFHYFFRVENLLPHEQTVTVRIYLAADAFAEDRRMWMEMDRFVHTLKPSERAVIFRPASLASVVHERGWPAKLLLPRGRREGMLFRFMVLITGWEQEPTGEELADTREPGYPFNRPVPPGQRIADMLTLSHLATRNIWIHHVTP
ncbi:tyrosinase family protein [Archangium lansingense]|uniref:Tyrosinase family protein n=1 Tax=Archangium lansingense TaxID=2995310 RepID=A0ABT4AD54_9BACT|nr:tyrosinase family protein [Archangium lansinium]MCY1078847.1 tyrosinase family protein [Archangium lansinium]